MDDIKAKILIELEKADNTTDSFKDGMGKLFDYLKADYRFKYIHEIENEDLGWCDIYIAVRPSTPSAVSICNRIVESNRIYIAYFDDDLLHNNSSLKWRRKNILHCIRNSTLVMAPNPRLGKEYGAICQKKRYVIVDTPIDEREFIVPHSRDNKIRIVYAAGRDHAHIFEKIVRNALYRIIKEYNNRIEVTFIGVKPQIDKLEDGSCISFIPLMPLDEYRRYMDSHQFDVGLAPLEDNSFSSKKYFNKFFEYTIKGVAGVYSNCSPYTYVIENNTNGVLVDNNQDEWYRSLKEIIMNPDLINLYLEGAQRTIRERFSLNTVALSFVESIPELNQSIHKKNIKWRQPAFRKDIFRALDKSNKFYQQIKTKGIRSGLELVANHVSDKKKRGQIK